MLDKEKIIRNFSRSAPSYEQHALLQKQMADQLLSAVTQMEPSRILDIGCGTGYLANKLAEQFARAEVIGIDIAPGMIEVASQRYRKDNLLFAVGDGEGLPFGKDSFDLIVSNASLQWMRAERTINEVGRVIRNQGCFLFKTFGPETLRELRLSGFRVNSFIGEDELKILLKIDFSQIKLGTETVETYFRNVRDLMLHLKEIGANTADSGQALNKTLRGALRKYNDNFRSENGIKATYEIITGSTRT